MKNSFNRRNSDATSTRSKDCESKKTMGGVLYFDSPRLLSVTTLPPFLFKTRELNFVGDPALSSLVLGLCWERLEDISNYGSESKVDDTSYAVLLTRLK